MLKYDIIINEGSGVFMALGKSAIDNARTSLKTVTSKITDARDTNKKFRDLFNDPNFQVFVKETNKGKQLNEHLTELADWMNRLCDAMEKLDTRTETYLAKQERYND